MCSITLWIAIQSYSSTMFWRSMHFAVVMKMTFALDHRLEGFCVRCHFPKAIQSYSSKMVWRSMHFAIFMKMTFAWMIIWNNSLNASWRVFWIRWQFVNRNLVLCLDWCLFVPCFHAFLGQEGPITLLLNSGPTLGPGRVVPYSPIKSLEFSF